MSETSTALEELFINFSEKFEAQAIAMKMLTRTLEKVKADAAESNKVITDQKTKLEKQGQTLL